MDTPSVKPEVPESAVEHRIEFVDHWVDRWTVPNPFVSLFLSGLAAWGVTLKDFGFNQDSKNIAEVALIINVGSLNSTIRVGVDSLIFRTSNPDWNMAPKLVELFDSVTDTFTDFVGSRIKSQEVTLVFHVTPGSMDFGKATAALVNGNLLGAGDFYGVTVNTSGRSLQLERSLKYKGGAFFRLTRVFEPTQKFVDVALALYTDEASALRLIGVEDVAWTKSFASQSAWLDEPSGMSASDPEFGLQSGINPGRAVLSHRVSDESFRSEPAGSLWSIKSAQENSSPAIFETTSRPASPSHHSNLEIVSQLERIKRNYAEADRSQLEATWLAANRHRYAGQWIALQGDNLLAHSTSSAEIFAAARQVKPRPLIMQIEADQTPFAGW